MNVNDRADLAGEHSKLVKWGKVIKKRGTDKGVERIESKMQSLLVHICLFFVCICEWKEMSGPSLWMST